MKHFAVFLASLGISWAATPLVASLAVRLRLVDEPNERRINTRPMPTGGGAAIFLGFILPVLIALPMSRFLSGLILCSSLMLTLGLIDDRRGLSPKTKFIGQIAVSLILTFYGVRIDFVSNPFGGMIYLGRLAIPLTVLWLVAVTNIINLIDGLDGLAAGITCIACLPIVLIAFQRGQEVVALLTIALAGSSLGFLRHNFNPAKIFMGDGGAMFLGFMLGAISVQGTLKGPAAIALSVPVLILGLPFFDTVFAIIRRFRRGRPIYAADNGHVHHRLLAMGLSQREAVMVMYLVSCFLGILALRIAGMNSAASTLTQIVAGVILLLGVRRLGTSTLGRFKDRLGG
jgi:UDP-GlcNAc:undecaprenyl-phosphate GlcNAc-1-phosphate transferase